MASSRKLVRVLWWTSIREEDYDLTSVTSSGDEIVKKEVVGENETMENAVYNTGTVKLSCQTCDGVRP